MHSPRHWEMVESFDADWLALREPFDAASRSVALAEMLAAVLPVRPRILDLGAGTGSMFRWLAPIIGRAQVWTFADADARLLEEAIAETADWAEDEGYVASWSIVAGRHALLVHTADGAWRVEARVIDIAAPDALKLGSVDAVVCSAVFDLVSERWLRRFAAALRVPLLACLSVDGRDGFLPRHPLDRTVLHAFRRDQGRDKGLGPALGPDAPQALHAALTARRFNVTSVASDWCVPADDIGMLDALVLGHATVAANRLPARRIAIIDWLRTRRRQAGRGRLAIRIGHRDSLALPARK